MQSPLASKLREVEERLQSSSASLDDALQRLREALARTYAARVQERRRGMQAQLDSTRRGVAESMASLFASPRSSGRQPPQRPPSGAAPPPQLERLPAMDDLEARVAAEYDVAQNGRSLACCLRASSERLYLAWGRLVFGALCWWYAIGEDAAEGEAGAQKAKL